MSDADEIRWLDLDDGDRERLRAALARRLPAWSHVKAAYLYGSAARREPARDIDIGLVTDAGRDDSTDVATIAAAIADDFGVRPEAIDVRVLDGGDPVFLGNVRRDGVLLYEQDREARIRFEVNASKVWLDYRPAWERLRKRVLARWSDG